MRLDTFLTENGMTESRNKASALIKNGCVFVNGKKTEKASYDVKEEDKIEIKENDVLEFVSRGGHKLKKAISFFSLDLKDKVICDIGSSTGGFTDCSLQNGARKVYAIDVGTDQLHPTLRKDNRVNVMENTNFKDVTLDMFSEKVDLYVCDVSFISIRAIIKRLCEIDKSFTLMCLFKPQFEVGPQKLNRNGVVKDEKYLIEALKEFSSFLQAYGISTLNFTYSPILGNKEGNIEFLYLLTKKKRKSILPDYEKEVREAVRNLRG